MNCNVSYYDNDFDFDDYVSSITTSLPDINETEITDTDVSLQVIPNA